MAAASGADFEFWSIPVRLGRGSRQAQEANLVVMTFNIRYGTANDGENNWANRKEMALRRPATARSGHCRAPGGFTIPDRRHPGGAAGVCGDRLRPGRRQDQGRVLRHPLPQGPPGRERLRHVLALRHAGGPRLHHLGQQLTRICTWGRFLPKGSGKPFYMFNTHLDHITQYSRDRAAILLAQRIRDRAHPDPVLVTGDFNAGENNSVVRYSQGRIGIEHRPTTACRRTPSRSWTPSACCTPTPRKSGPSTASRASVRATRSTTSSPSRARRCSGREILRDNKDNRYPSDHFPVIAVIVLGSSKNN